jgi:hypothetical protein
MPNIVVKADAGKKYIEYNTDLMIDGNLPHRAHFTQIYGFGIKRGSGTSAKLIARDGWDNVTLDSPSSGTSGYWEDFFKNVKEAGLSSIIDPGDVARSNTDPNRPFPKWDVYASLSDSEKADPAKCNIMSNYMYDELLSYINAGYQSRIINVMSGNGYTCDGSASIPSNVLPRVVSGVTLNMLADGELGSVSRRDGFAAGLVNNTYRGTLTPALVTFLKNEVGITTYSNVNVIGPESEWNGESRTQFTFKNSGIKGTYQNALESKFGGIIDIDINKSIINGGSLDAKLILHSSPTNNIGFLGFKVVDTSNLPISTTDWSKVGAIQVDGSNYTPPVVIIYPSISAAQGFGGAPGPNYRAYKTQSGTPQYKFAHITVSEDTTGKVKSLGPITQVLPRYLEDDKWEAIGNGTTYTTRQWGQITSLAPMYSVFNSIPDADILSIAPFHSDTYLAGAASLPIQNVSHSGHSLWGGFHAAQAVRKRRG